MKQISKTSYDVKSDKESKKSRENEYIIINKMHHTDM